MAVAVSLGGYRLEMLGLIPALIGYAVSVALMAVAMLFLLVGMIGGRGRMGSRVFNAACWIALVLSVGHDAEQPAVVPPGAGVPADP